MKLLTLSAAFALALVAGASGPAEAKGCIKGAAVGTVVGRVSREEQRIAHSSPSNRYASSLK